MQIFGCLSAKQYKNNQDKEKKGGGQMSGWWLI